MKTILTGLINHNKNTPNNVNQLYAPIGHELRACFNTHKDDIKKILVSNNPTCGNIRGIFESIWDNCLKELNPNPFDNVSEKNCSGNLKDIEK